jgi:hypothetical protein
MATSEMRVKLLETRHLRVTLATCEMRGKLPETSHDYDFMVNGLRTRNSLIPGCVQQ